MAEVVMADDGIAFDGVKAEEGPLGGAETAFAALAEALARRGHQVAVRNRCQTALCYNGVQWRLCRREYRPTVTCTSAAAGTASLALFEKRGEGCSGCTIPPVI